MAKVQFKTYPQRNCSFSFQSWRKNSQGSSSLPPEQDSGRARLDRAHPHIQVRRHNSVPSPYVAQGGVLCLHEQHILLPQDRGRNELKHPVHVAQRQPAPFLLDNQPLPVRTHEGLREQLVHSGSEDNGGTGPGEPCRTVH